MLKPWFATCIFNEWSYNPYHYRANGDAEKTGQKDKKKDEKKLAHGTGNFIGSTQNGLGKGNGIGDGRTAPNRVPKAGQKISGQGQPKTIGSVSARRAVSDKKVNKAKTARQWDKKR